MHFASFNSSHIFWPLGAIPHTLWLFLGYTVRSTPPQNYVGTSDCQNVKGTFQIQLPSKAYRPLLITF